MPVAPATPNPLSSVKVTKHVIPRIGTIPNSAITSFPLVMYHGLFPPEQSTQEGVDAHLKKIGAVDPMWSHPMYPDDHFHSNAHEILVIINGSARCLFGGDDNPNKVIIEVSRGDGFIIPAGVSHRLVEDTTPGGGFKMRGSYPVDSEHWDLCYGKPDEGNVDERIKKVAWLEKDPSPGGSSFLTIESYAGRSLGLTNVSTGINIAEVRVHGISVVKRGSWGRRQGGTCHRLYIPGRQ